MVGSGCIQHRLFFHLWDLRRAGWVDRGWSRGREPKWPLLDIRLKLRLRWEWTWILPVLIDIMWYVIEASTCRWFRALISLRWLYLLHLSQC